MHLLQLFLPQHQRSENPRHSLPNQYLLHDLLPSALNVHTSSTQTAGTVMQVYFHDGSHLPFSPLMSLARLSNDSQHIALAAICLSAFTAKQTSEQPCSLMSGGLQIAPASLSAPPHPPSSPLPLFSVLPLHLAPPPAQTTFIRCFVSSAGFLRPSLLLLCFIFISAASPGFPPVLLRPHSFRSRSRWLRAAICLPAPARG